MCKSNLQYTVHTNVLTGLFSRILRVNPRKNFHLNIWLFIVLKENIKPSWISPPSPKSWKYLYVKYMVYTVGYRVEMI